MSTLGYSDTVRFVKVNTRDTVRCLTLSDFFLYVTYKTMASPNNLLQNYDLYLAKGAQVVSFPIKDVQLCKQNFAYYSAILYNLSISRLPTGDQNDYVVFSKTESGFQAGYSDESIYVQMSDSENFDMIDSEDDDMTDSEDFDMIFPEASASQVDGSRQSLIVRFPKAAMIRSETTYNCENSSTSSTTNSSAGIEENENDMDVGAEGRVKANVEKIKTAVAKYAEKPYNWAQLTIERASRFVIVKDVYSSVEDCEDAVHIAKGLGDAAYLIQRKVNTQLYNMVLGLPKDRQKKYRGIESKSYNEWKDGERTRNGKIAKI